MKKPKVLKRPTSLPKKPEKIVTKNKLIARLDEITNGFTPLTEIIGDSPIDELFIEIEHNWDDIRINITHAYNEPNKEFKEQMRLWKIKEKKYKDDMKEYLEFTKQEAKKKLSDIDVQIAKYDH